MIPFERAIKMCDVIPERLQSVRFDLKSDHLKTFRHHITFFNSSLTGNHAVGTVFTQANV